MSFNKAGLSNMIACKSGALIDKEKVIEALYAYWSLSDSDRKEFDRLKSREDFKEQYLKENAEVI